MIVAFWCVLFAGVLPYACSYAAKLGHDEAVGRFDNREPRAWLARQTGRRARAHAAEANSFEAFPPFAVGVVVCVVQHVPVSTIDLLAMVFIAFRIAYVVAYLADRPSLRSLLWAGGFATTVGLFIAASTGTLR